jgi:hypothetical protein
MRRSGDWQGWNRLGKTLGVDPHVEVGPLEGHVAATPEGDGDGSMVGEG